MHTYFLSDLHLSPERPDISAAFLRFLTKQASSAEQLYLLGDLFEYWIGDDAAAMVGADQILTAMKTVSEQIPCYFIAGNRDFLVGEQFETNSGFKILPDETVIDLYGNKTLILHGDSLCTDDLAHMLFREQMVTNIQWRNNFLSHTIPERIELAKMAREQSMQHKSSVTMEIMDVTEAAVIDRFEDNNVLQMIHGHTHRQDKHHYTLNANLGTATRYVLGDWDKSSSIIIASKEGIEIKNLPLLNK